MDRNKICEAMYALPGGVVVKRRKSQLRAAVLFIAGVAFEYADLEYKPLTRLNIVDKA